MRHRHRGNLELLTLGACIHGTGTAVGRTTRHQRLKCHHPDFCTRDKNHGDINPTQSDQKLQFHAGINSVIMSAHREAGPESHNEQRNLFHGICSIIIPK